jgi:hypothetical protein
LRSKVPDRRFSHRPRLAAAVLLVGAVVAAPQLAAAQGFFDFLFGGLQRALPARPPAQASFFADPSNPPAPPRPLTSSSGPAYCVRSCDGRYFPLTARGGSSPAQLCQAFCPASVTKVFFGGSIDGATSVNGERYADSENAYLYRKTLRADCTCNGRDPAGLAPVDLTLDSSLRAGDVIATTDGLVAYSGIRLGAGQTADFTPVASYPGLTADVRARLGEMKVAPVSADTVAADTPLVDSGHDVVPAAITARR